MNNDLISRDALKKAIDDYAEKRQDTLLWQADIEELIDNAPTVDLVSPTIKVNVSEETKQKLIEELQKPHMPLILPEPECVPISKLRLMTVEECAGHTIEYAMGWKACIDWLKKGGAE